MFVSVRYSCTLLPPSSSLSTLRPHPVGVGIPYFLCPFIANGLFSPPFRWCLVVGLDFQGIRTLKRIGGVVCESHCRLELDFGTGLCKILSWCVIYDMHEDLRRWRTLERMKQTWT